MSKIINNNRGLMTILIIAGVLISYVQQMAPSPLLSILKEGFHIQSDALINLSVSIVFPMVIIASILGSTIEQKIGNRNLYILTMGFLAAGILTNYISTSYILFLIGRAVYGIGFGLGIPFIGAAIMKWYTPKQQIVMNTINGLFPYVGTVISFSLLVPLYRAFGDSWKQALGIWGIGILVIGALWALFIKPQEDETTGTVNQVEKNLYNDLWKRRDIKLLCGTFIFDFFCYSYICVILPTFLMLIGNMTEEAAGFWAAVALPAVGIVGGILGGMVMSVTGKRKPPMALGQLLKFLGILGIVFGANTSFWLVITGAALFGLGDGMWVPGMYTVGMELEDMTPTRVGAAFALISSCGFAAGFISPIIGGWLTNILMPMAGFSDVSLSHVFGLKWSLFIFAFTNLICFVCVLLLKETGPGLPKEESNIVLP